MSQEREGQETTFTCDNCGETFTISGGDFKDSWEAAKQDGWRCFKNDDEEWEHRCPDCVRKP